MTIDVSKRSFFKNIFGYQISFFNILVAAGSEGTIVLRKFNRRNVWFRIFILRKRRNKIEIRNGCKSFLTKNTKFNSFIYVSIESLLFVQGYANWKPRLLFLLGDFISPQTLTRFPSTRSQPKVFNLWQTISSENCWIGALHRKLDSRNLQKQLFLFSIHVAFRIHRIHVCWYL